MYFNIYNIFIMQLFNLLRHFIQSHDYKDKINIFIIIIIQHIKYYCLNHCAKWIP